MRSLAGNRDFIPITHYPLFTSAYKQAKEYWCRHLSSVSPTKWLRWPHSPESLVYRVGRKFCPLFFQSNQWYKNAFLLTKLNKHVTALWIDVMNEIYVAKVVSSQCARLQRHEFEQHDLGVILKAQKDNWGQWLTTSSEHARWVQLDFLARAG